REQILLVESRDWTADALTADRVAAMQAFRDLFSDAVLRPGDEVGIAHVTLMFTDLKGSTAMYSRAGDASAYHRVREHFAFLARVVRENNGAVVKTIGDAVMAAFSEPADGVRAALAIQRNIAGLNAADAGEPLVIRLGLHGGPCIAVTLNQRLDYFGSTVNLAARLQGQSAGGDVVLSAALAADPAVAELLGATPRADEVAPIRGFPDPVGFCRLAVDAVVTT
ncbi:MAG: adenylate/guanylate cyclase domain-containing protein, partial [Alphaproteobacteria bacterium]